jgi:hypothetical protein
MKHGCMVMTLRLSSSRHSESHQIHHGQKKRAKFAVMSSPCWFFFLTSNFQWQVLLWGFCNWGRSFIASVQTGGRITIGFSTMTTRPLTHHSFDTSWLPETLQWSPPPFAWPHPLRLFPFPKMKLWQKASFWHSWGDRCRIARGYRHSHLRTSGMHKIIGNMLGSLYTFPRGLLWRRRRELGSYSNKLILMVKFPEVLGSITYVH